jgi:hypothetical protein
MVIRKGSGIKSILSQLVIKIFIFSATNVWICSKAGQIDQVLFCEEDIKISLRKYLI